VVERRRYERRVVQFEATLSFAGDSTLHAGICRDLSEGGLYLATPARAEAGTEGRLMTSMPGSSELITLPVVVRWHGRDGMGLQFGALEDHVGKAVERALLRAVPKRSIPPARGRSPAWLRAVGLIAALAAAATAGFVGSRYSQRVRQMLGAPSATAVAPSATTSQSSPAVSQAPPATASVVASASASIAPPAVASLAPSPVAPAVPASGDGDPSACIGAFFPDKAFRQDERLDFVCNEADPRKAATQMRVKIVIGSSGQPTPAVNEWSRLGWYELAVMAITRRACCGGAPPLQLPDSPSPCASLTSTLTALGDAVATRNNVEAGAKAFETAADCIQMSGKGGYRYTAGPFSGSQVAFASFLKRNEHSAGR